MIDTNRNEETVGVPNESRDGRDGRDGTRLNDMQVIVGKFTE